MVLRFTVSDTCDHICVPYTDTPIFNHIPIRNTFVFQSPNAVLSLIFSSIYVCLRFGSWSVWQPFEIKRHRRHVIVLNQTLSRTGFCFLFLHPPNPAMLMPQTRWATALENSVRERTLTNWSVGISPLWCLFGDAVARPDAGNWWHKCADRQGESANQLIKQCSKPWLVDD